MSCIGCEHWQWDGEKSTLGVDLMYGICSETGRKTAHNETCDAYKEKMLPEETKPCR